MRNSGYENTYLNHKFNPDPFIDSTWIISTLDNDIISSKENKITVLASSNMSNLKKGKKRFIDGEIINEPLDFSSKNRSSLTDMHNIIKNLIYPETSLSKFNLNVEVLQKDIFEQKNLSSDIIVARAFKPLPIILNLIHENFKFFKEVILFLGKNAKEMLRDVLKEWEFEYQEKKSITSDDSIILKISKLKKR